MSQSVLFNAFVLIYIFATAIIAISAPTPLPKSGYIHPPFLPPPDPSSCIPPLVLCNRACCSPGSTCATTGFCVPPPPPAPKIWITYTNTAAGVPSLITVHGTGFPEGGDVWIQGVNVVNEWAVYGFPGPNFEYATGIQDFSKDGRSTAATDGFAGWVEAWDKKSDTETPRIPVRIRADGTYPQLRMAEIPFT